MPKIYYWIIPAVVFVTLSVAGCQSTTGLYVGAKADPETIIVFTDVPEGVQHWQDLYVKVACSFVVQGNQLLTEGFFEFADHPQGMLALVNDFKLKLFLLDQNDRVLDYFDLARSLGGNLASKTAFAKSFSLPAGAVAVSFGYEGTFIGEKNDPGEIVWKLPKRSF